MLRLRSRPMGIFAFIVLVLATYRITRLWRYDTILEPVRSRIIGSDDRTGWLLAHPNSVTLWLLELLECPWCVSVHVAFWSLLTGVSTGVVAVGNVAVFIGLWMAVSAGSAWCFGIESKLFLDD